MTDTTAATAAAPRSRAARALPALRVTAVLSTLNVLYQAATAGEILMRDREAVEWHGTGAVVLHVVTGLTTLAALWFAREARGPWWPAVLSAVVFVASFVVAWYGKGSTLYLHVPLALVLTVGTVWVTAWAFTTSAHPVGR